MRADKEILDATRPFAVEHRGQSWGYVAGSFALAVALGAGALLLPWTGARWGCSALLGLTLVRLFILFHDFYHGAILRGSRLARALFGAFGVLVLTPPGVWRQTHNYHHAHNGKIVGSHVGSYPVVTVAMWRGMSPAARLGYRAARHPVTIALGALTVFAWGMCVSPFLRDPRRNCAAALTLVFHVALAFTLVHLLGFSAYLRVVVAPLGIAMACGAYLFYAQHNFPGVFLQPRDRWSYVRAALESSSYLPMGPVMRFFTGSIGYHHVHHLNPSIPFYRLADAMDAIPELQAPRTTSLRPRDVLACFRLAMWDPAAGRMVAWTEGAERE